MFNSQLSAILLLAITVLLCCKPAQKTELPPFVLDSETIERVLTDVHLTESVLVRKQSQGLLAFDLSEIYYDSLFAKHKISRQQFDSTIAYYSRNPVELEVIYTNIIIKLSKIESENNMSDDMREPEAEN